MTMMTFISVRTNSEMVRFHVIRTLTGNVLNKVERAPDERELDRPEVKFEKRKAYAVKLAQQWMQTYFLAETVQVKQV